MPSRASNRGSTPWLQDPDVTLYHGDVLATLRELPAESVDCVVTSPPYWGLRDYGTGEWEGGDAGCDHKMPGANKVFGNPGRGVPEQVCRVCGKARERVVEKETTPTQRVHNGVYDASSGFGKSGWLPGVQNVQTLGWTDCECSLSEREPLQPGTSTASAPVSRSESEQVSAQAKAGKAMGNHCLSEAVGVDTRRWVEAIIDRPPPPTTNYRPGIVLDPFMGSGTVAYVARKLGRHAVGIDLSAEYLALAAKRLQQQSLFAEAQSGL